ncbi:putative N-acetyltransferase [Cyphellophora attinorum]|uniref:N-alpha-acetyltransferase 40 n=1 Tax=Cyphellophora attinorum TaxID=1664694 RepID=A0A0N0NSK7_9EURO|nr:putative N-acetyltransferase [Phialophora attinorum]KPI46099.1 putative N-acetyltransferase [Phialophora attinorum]
MKKSEKRVEAANKLDIRDLFQQYCPEPAWKAFSEKAQAADLEIATADAESLSAEQLNACLDLVELTSAEDYRNSETGWSRSKKRREMKLPEMRYILLFGPPGAVQSLPASELAGFVSFMITYEDGYEVVYVYEIHFAPASQGKGFGRLLMEVIAALGSNVGLEKAMLTVFKSNARATDWYLKLEYSVDEFSPPARRLRGGVLKEPTYTILSKRIKAEGD